MRLVKRITDRLGGGSEGYRCGFCAQSFDSERLNCPACGYPDVRET